MICFLIYTKINSQIYLYIFIIFDKTIYIKLCTNKVLQNSINSSLIFAQKIGHKPVYTMKDAITTAGSQATAYRRLNKLKELGIVKHKHGGLFTFTTNIATQPANIIEKLLPSLKSLKKGKRLGRYYTNSDIKFVKENLTYELITLDYKAWEITNFQSPRDLYVYVKDFEYALDLLKRNKFNSGKKGKVVLLPMEGNFNNEIERVYFDCIAKGGRSILDAIAIEILHGKYLKTKGYFTIDLIRKVQEDLPHNMQLNLD